MENHLTKSKVFFYMLFLGILYISFSIILPYLQTVAISLITVVLFLPVYGFFMKISNGHKGISTFSTIMTIFLVVLIPLGFIVNMTIQQGNSFYNDITNMVNSGDVSFQSAVGEANKFIEQFPFITYRLTESEVQKTLQPVLQQVGNAFFANVLTISSVTLDLLTKFILFLILISALFPNYPKLIHYYKIFSPLNDEIDQIYINRIVAMAKSMIKGSFIIALTQGIVCGIVINVLGIKYALFLTILSIFVAFIPIISTNLVMVPVGIYIMLTGNIVGGVAVLLIQGLGIANIDTLLRPRLVSKEVEMHSALLVLSIFGGLSVFGPLGLLYGPIIMIFLVTTFEIYITYYRGNDRDDLPVVQ